MKTIKLVLLVIVLVGGAYFIGGKINKEIVYEQIEKQVILDNLTEKVNELKGSLINDLRQCESGGYVESDGLVTFDPHPTNKKVQVPSFGLYQQKQSFVQNYYKTLYNKDVTGLEAIQIALSEEKSAELTSDVIFKTKNGLSNWYNCSKKLGLQSRLDIINSLLK